MYKLLALPIVMLVLPLLAGCNRVTPPADIATSSRAGVAVIDLDEIARQLGSDRQIVSAIKQREAALNSKLGEIAQAYTNEFKKQKQAFEAEEQQQDGAVQLANYQKQVNQSFRTAQNQAQQNLAKHRERLVQQFREAVRPAARKVAQQRGLDLIVTKQDSLLYDYAPECDITEEVVKVLRASAAKRPAATEAKPATEE